MDRPCGGKAEDIGETWFWFPASASRVTVDAEPKILGGFIVLGVGGAPLLLDTLPMNHD